jgi:hypothetical protein
VGIQDEFIKETGLSGFADIDIGNGQSVCAYSDGYVRWLERRASNTTESKTDTPTNTASKEVAALLKSYRESQHSIEFYHYFESRIETLWQLLT